MTLLYIITGTVRFYNYYIKGMPKIQTFQIAFHHFPLSIDKISWSLTIFIDLVFYLLATPRSNYTRNWGYFEWAADLYFEKLGKIKNLANISHPKKTLKQVLKKRYVLLKLFFKRLVILNCLILRLSIFATQLSTNSQFVWNQFSFSDEKENKCIFR